MKIQLAVTDQMDQIKKLAQLAYHQECIQNSSLPKDAERLITEELFYNSIHAKHCFVCTEEKEVIGYLLFSHIQNDETITTLYSPIYGCGILPTRMDRTKIMSRLLQHALSQLDLSGNIHIECKVYSHDHDILTLLVMTQFGIQCSECIRRTPDNLSDSLTNNLSDSLTNNLCDNLSDHLLVKPNNTALSRITIQELNKQEIKENLSHLLNLFQKIVSHLRRSPVFYPGYEFTNEVYTDYILDPATRVFAAFHDDRIIGIIDANTDGNCFINSEQDCFNIGDVYVEKPFRNQKVATQLLSFANETLKKEGIKYVWVEHGTANPNARGFWDKYFKPYSYTLIRDIHVN